jgi:excisionase family DNA binding protein
VPANALECADLIGPVPVVCERRNEAVFDERFVAALASQIAARIIPQLHRDNGSRVAAARLLTVKQAAVYVGRTEQAVQHLIHKRELVVVRRGRRVHIDRGDLDRWIEANKV